MYVLASMYSGLRCKAIGSRQIVNMLLLCIAILILVLVAAFQIGEFDVAEHTVDTAGALSAPNARLEDYCSEKVRHGVEAFAFSGQDLFELSHLLITIRHGDRSSIHSFPQSNPPTAYSPGVLLDETVKHSLRLLPVFKLSAIPSRQADAPKGESLIHALDPAILFSIPDGALSQGQLTSRGFMQHVSLGSVLHNAYRPFLNKLHRINQVYVRSTNYARTVQSVAALLSTFLPRHMLQEAQRIPIEFFESEADEVMHGVGLRSSSHSSSSSALQRAEKEHLGSCNAAVRLAMQQRGHFQRLGRVYNDLAAAFGSEITSSVVTDLVDGSLPLFCHSHPLPCTNATSHGTMRSRAACLTTEQLRLLVQEADRFYCQRFAGSQGGEQATRLAFQPFLSEVLTRLQDAEKDGTLLTVFSGHDTVIAPLLSVLGVYSNADLCVWPGYASRVVFELYTPRLSAMPKVTKDDVHRWRRGHSALLQTADAKKGDATTPSALLPESTQYVRILFNGREITSLVPACQHARQVLQRRMLTDWPAPDAPGEESPENEERRRRLLRRDFALVSHDSPLCPLPALQDMLQNLVAPHSDLRRACQ